MTLAESIGVRFFLHSKWYWEIVFWWRRNLHCWFTHRFIEELGSEPYVHAGWWCSGCMREVTFKEIVAKGYSKIEFYQQ